MKVMGNLENQRAKIPPWASHGKENSVPRRIHETELQAKTGKQVITLV